LQHFEERGCFSLSGQLPASSSERIVSAMKPLVIVGLLLAVVIGDAAPRLKVPGGA
jgi:hypothetical protein